MSKYKKPQSKNNFFEQMNLNKSRSNAGSGSKNKQEAIEKQEYQAIDTLPIVKVQMNSKREAEHFEDAYQFALRESDPNSNEILTVHMDMNDELHFNIQQDEAFKSAWEKGEMMLLIALPRNWKTMPIEVESDMEEDDAAVDFDSAEERFDYLYEIGMSVYEG